MKENLSIESEVVSRDQVQVQNWIGLHSKLFMAVIYGKGRTCPPSIMTWHYEKHEFRVWS